MEKNTQEKSLVQVNENSIFYKIKRFFKNLFTFFSLVGAILSPPEMILSKKEKSLF